VPGYDGRMDEAPEPGDRRPAGDGPRRLERPPGARYAAAAGGDATVSRTGPIRGILLAAGAMGSAASIALFAVASISAGLVVVAALTGLLVAEALRAGAGDTISPRLRRTLSLSTAIESVAIAQVGIWLFARYEGGALGLIDYLAQTFGPLVPLQFAIAALVAWWSAR
jgi:hypothetical protein